jgi:TonB family protein
MSKPVFLRIFKDSELIGVKQFGGEQIVIGREGEVDVLLEDASISPIHAMIEKREAGYYICDLGSQAGTSLNGTVVLDEPISNQDLIKLGIFQLEFYIGIPKPKSAPVKPGNPAVVAAVPIVTTPIQETRIDEDGDEDEIVPVAVVEKSPPQLPQDPVRVESVVPPKPAPTQQVQAEPEKRKEEKKSTIAKVAGPSEPVQPSTASPKQQPASFSQAAPREIQVDSIIVPVRASTATFAPPSEVSDLKKTIHPTKGTTLEILVAWQDRVLKTYHFEKRGVVTFGSHPKNDIVVPAVSGTRLSHPLIQWEGQPQVLISNDMNGEVTRGDRPESFQSLIQAGRLIQSGSFYKYQLNQEELVVLECGDGVQLFIRFCTAVPKPLAAPILGLAASELTGLVLGGVALGVALIYMALTSPNKDPEEDVEDLMQEQRKAVFVYKKTQKAADQVAQTTQDTQKLTGQQSGNPIPQEGTKPAEAKPNNSKSTQKKLTAQNVGSGNGNPTNTSKTGELTKKGSPAPRPDVKKTGLLGVFGKSGTQNELERAFQGADQVGTLGQTASGKTGLGVGDNPNANSPGLRDVGQGGSGVATVGIAGVGTKGKGGGNVGYGEGNFGGKKGVQIIPGGQEEAFTGMIDREAIRRVIQSRLREMKACYEKGLNRDPSLGGKIVLEWTIGKQGRVTEASVKNSTMGNAEVEQCALSRLRTWRFPEPPVGREAEVTYPFVFAAQN